MAREARQSNKNVGWAPTPPPQRLAREERERSRAGDARATSPAPSVKGAVQSDRSEKPSSGSPPLPSTAAVEADAERETQTPKPEPGGGAARGHPGTGHALGSRGAPEEPRGPGARGSISLADLSLDDDVRRMIREEGKHFKSFSQDFFCQICPR